MQREKKRWENINSLVCQTRRAQQLFTCFLSFYAQMLWIKTQKCLADYDVRFCLSPVRAWLPSSPGCCISVQSCRLRCLRALARAQGDTAEDFCLLLSPFNPLWWIWRFAGGVIYVALWHIADARKALNQYS